MPAICAPSSLALAGHFETRSGGAAKGPCVPRRAHRAASQGRVGYWPVWRSVCGPRFFFCRCAIPGSFRAASPCMQQYIMQYITQRRRETQLSPEKKGLRCVRLLDTDH